MISDLAAAYQRHKVVLWVEDVDTAGYLREAWDDPEIGYMIAGKSDSVHAAVLDARTQGVANAFGFVDRDFKRPNRSRWLLSPEEFAVYIPEAHEIECYAVDEIAVSALDRNLNPKDRQVADVREKAFEIAKMGTWWMALRSFLSEVSIGVTRGFPSHPKVHKGSKPTVPTLDVAEAFVRQRLASEWIPTAKEVIAQAIDADGVRSRLTELEAGYAGALDGENWRTTFSGHEMFDAMAVYVYYHAPGRKKGDLLRGIGAAQRRLHRVPAEMLDLQRSLRRRVGLPDPAQ